MKQLSEELGLHFNAGLISHDEPSCPGRLWDTVLCLYQPFNFSVLIWKHVLQKPIGVIYPSPIPLSQQMLIDFGHWV